MPPAPIQRIHRSGVWGSLKRRSSLATIATFAVGAVIGFGSLAYAAPGTSSISGFAFYDANRNAVMDSGEQPLSGVRMYLVDATANADVANTLTDASGHYTFGGLADGNYRVDCDCGLSANDWVPTTTGTLYGNVTLTLAGSATADFGWRQIVRSTTAGSPMSQYTGANGLRVESYDDAVPAKDIYDDLMRGALVGPEAQYVTIRFDLGNVSLTSTSVGNSNGVYSGYRATSDITYASWLGQSDDTLFHEYGHAWSWYYAYIAQQDPKFSGYLKARGLAGDTRVGSGYQWQPSEMIAEDYRQLFGTSSAASYPQMNQQIPAAAQVAGLKDYLQTTFMQPATASSSSTAPPPAPVAITGLTVSPGVVSKSATISFSISTPASVTITILSGSGSPVRTLLASVSKSSGTVSAVWDRKNSAGQRVKSGAYSARVDATDSSGQTATAKASFQVS